jgi:hypothetical protein
VEVLRAQAEARLAQAPPAVREQARREHAHLLEELEAGRTPPELVGDAQWIREILAVDPTAMITKLKARLLIAQGAKDFEVDPEADANALARAARRANLRHDLRRYPDLDHLFKPEPGDSTPQRYLAEDRHLDPTFLTDLVTWSRRATR